MWTPLPALATLLIQEINLTQLEEQVRLQRSTMHFPKWKLLKVARFKLRLGLARPPKHSHLRWHQRPLSPFSPLAIPTTPSFTIPTITTTAPTPTPTPTISTLDLDMTMTMPMSFIDTRKQENWDADFDFDDEDEYEPPINGRQRHEIHALNPIIDLTTSSKHLPDPESDEENWDEDFPPDNEYDYTDARSRPSTSHSLHVAAAATSGTEAGFVSRKTVENWDDDFEDDNPAPETSSHQNTEAKVDLPDEAEEIEVAEDWDQELGLQPAEPSSSTGDPFLSDLTRSNTPEWSSARERDAVVRNGSRATAWTSTSMDPDESHSSLAYLKDSRVILNDADVDSDLEEEQEEEEGEDTATRPLARQLLLPSPLPLAPTPTDLPLRSLPQSPATSEFSMPRTAQESIYSSTGLMAYRSTPTFGPQFPSSPPKREERQRRRLKKKSRPQEDVGVYEMQDRIVEGDREDEPEPPRPSTPVRATTPPPLHVETPASPASPASPSANGRLAKMGSVKRRWGRSRASTGPAEVPADQQQLQQPPTQKQPEASSSSRPTPRPSTPNRWFKNVVSGSGSPDLRRFRSKDHLPDDKTPRAGGGGGRMRSSTVGSVPSPAPGRFEVPTAKPAPANTKKGLDPRRPISMQPPSRRSIDAMKEFPKSVEVPMPIEEKDGGATIGRSTSMKVKMALHQHQHQRPPSSSRPSSPSSPPREGMRSFMQGVRRISLIGRHKRVRSQSNNMGSTSASESEKAGGGAGNASGSDARTETPLPSFTASSLALSVPRGAATPSPMPSMAPTTSTWATRPSTPANQLQVKPPASPQAASLGRATTAPSGSPGNEAHRRSSLGDLKIPSRIRSAQNGIKRDLSMVKEFAGCIEMLKQLQQSYGLLSSRISEATSPASPTIQYHLPRQLSRDRSRSVSEATAQALTRIEKQYRKWWDAAEVLIHLGGSGAEEKTPPPSANSANGNANGFLSDHPEEKEVPSTRKDRAITFEAPPKGKGNSLKRESNGNGDLSERQLLILKEMLDTPNLGTSALPLQDLPEISSNSLVAKRYPMASATTLPSEDGDVGIDDVPIDEKHKKRRSRLKGIKVMWRGLTKGGSGDAQDAKRHPSDLTQETQTDSMMPPTNSSASGFSTTGDVHPRVVDHQDAYIRSHSIDIRRHPNSPYGTTTAVAGDIPHKSPRRPSLASIFRLGGHGPKTKDHTGKVANHTTQPANLRDSTTDDEGEADWDWDHISDASPGLQRARSKKEAQATVRDKHRLHPKRQPSKNRFSRPGTAASTNKTNGSQVSLNQRDAAPRALSEQVPASHQKQHQQRPPSSRSLKNRDDVFESRAPSRAMTPGVLTSDARLILTPENIQPLLGYARKVSSELDKCVGEMRLLAPADVAV